MHTDTLEQANVRQDARPAAKPPEDARKKAEEFIDKVVAPARRTQIPDPETVRAKAELAREELELAKRELTAVGFDSDRLEKLAAESSKKHGKLAEDSRRRAVDASAAAWDRLKGLIPPILPAEPVDTVIDEVTFIRGFAGQGRRGEWNIGPGDNWAKYRLESGTDDADPSLPGRLSFFILWQNKRNAPTVLMARPQLIVNAHLSCEATGGGFAGWLGGTISRADATVRARTTVWSMDSSVSSIVNDQMLASASARGGFFGDDDSESIAFNQLLPATGVTIPPQAFSLIEVELRTEWSGIGSVTLDAEGGSHRVDVPQLVLTEMQMPEPPPISVVAGVDYATTPPTVTLIFSGATGALVDIYQNGVRLGDTENDGTWSFPINPGTYTFRVCEKLSNVCSNDVTVTVT